MKDNKKLIRNSTADFLTFTSQAEGKIEVCSILELTSQHGTVKGK